MMQRSKQEILRILELKAWEHVKIGYTLEAREENCF